MNQVLINAFKYANTHVAKPKLTVRLQPVTYGPVTGLLVEVQDNGPGLGETGRTDVRLEGTGLNSPIPASCWRKGSFSQRLIRELTDPLGGQMSLTSRHDTYFRLWIPTPARIGPA
ncbi:hypothetical protein [Spirosoma jeollabukense]